METKHTPGPWRANFNVRHEFWVVESLTEDAEICQDRGWGGEYAEQDIANAHLISAAPELLEALEKAFDFPPDFFDRSDDELEQITVSGRHLRMVRAAIAKARGETC